MKIILSALYPYAFFILLLIMPFDEYLRALPNILLIILVVTFPFIIKKEDFKKLYTAPALIFFVFVIFLVLNSLFLDRIDGNFKVVNKILIPVGVIILYLPINDFKKINKAIIFSSLIAIAYSLYNIAFLINDTGTFEFGNSRNPLDTLLIDRLYLGLLSVISILVSYKSLTKKFNPYNSYNLANIIINILFVFLIVSRIAIITLIVLAVLKLFYGKIRLWKIAATLALMSMTIVVAYVFNDNIEKRFLFTTANNAEESLIDKIMRWEPRTKIWECAYIIAETESSFFQGLGFEGTNEKLIDCYKWNIENVGRKEWFLVEKYNTHNQFIDFYLSTGILSVILFVGLFVTLFLKNRKNYFSSALLVTMFLFAIVENFFHRQIGAYYFGIILIFLLLNYQDNKDQTKKNLLEN